MPYLLGQAWRWSKSFSEGRGLEDKLVLFPGGLCRLASYTLGYFRVPWLPPLLFMLGRPLASVVVRNRDGLFYCRKGKDDDAIATEAFEFPLRTCFEEFKQGTFVDVGANIGKYTIMLGKQIGDRGRVVSIEPHPECYEVLKLNIELNGLENVSALNRACWNESAELDLYTASGLSTSGSHSVKKRVSHRSIRARCARLDDVLRDLRVDTADFIKIDVEGAEAEVLEGAQQTIGNSNRLKILFEAYDKESLRKCLHILDGHSMAVRRVYRDNFLAQK
jgi:FkbM family methyltransferase